jgi:Flp pilus assembly pilin Flp
MTKKHAKKGQGFVEYALIMLLVALAVIVALAIFGPGVGSIYSNAIPLL